jgi:DNA-binding MarR family transcriptional regulator
MVTVDTKTNPGWPAELVESSAFLLKRLGFAAKERASAAYERTGLTPYHHAVLIALDEDSHETQGAIADRLGYDHGQLVGLLDDLESKGLAVRKRDPGDRRRQLVSLTPEGKKALTRLRALSRKLENELFAPLDEAKRARLHALLLELARHHFPAKI